VFIKLANKLYNKGFIQDSNLFNIKEKLSIFLLVFTVNNSYYKVGEKTQYSLVIIYI
jgi:hypothetical protein